ncbi:hypothetical protein KDL45_03720 [bacterium]|nr:hypothetical protein [bacterium]
MNVKLRGIWPNTAILILLAALLAFSTMGSSCGGDDDDDDTSDDDTVDDDDTTDDDTGDDDTSDDDTTDDDTGDDDTGDDDVVVEPADLEAPPFPEWVYRHWIWEDESTATSVNALIDGYKNRDIPVGAVIIDSPWATGYSTFEFDPARFPDAAQTIAGIRDQGVRVFLWSVSNVNTDSPNWQYGLDNGYYVEDGKTYEWWKGDGAFIDYWNTDAMDWWHGMMDNVLEMGVDGWKTDGSEPSMLLGSPGGVETADGKKSFKEYQEAYYRDFFEYSRENYGEDRVISSRPVDSYGIPVTVTFSPRDVCFAGWVGDQDGTFAGLRAALNNLMRSGEENYVNFGSDVGGYRKGDERTDELMIRWTQLGAFSPIMEQGNPEDIYIWDFEDDTVDIYRDFVKIHHSLIPYLYSQGATAWYDGGSLWKPIDRKGGFYNLGDALFVAAMMEEGTKRTVNFPEGASYIGLFDGQDYAGGTAPEIDVPYTEYPVFLKVGEILVRDLAEEYTFGLGPTTPHLTVTFAPDGSDSFELYEEGGSGAVIAYEQTGSGLDVTITGTERTFDFHVLKAAQPASIASEGVGDLTSHDTKGAYDAADAGYYYDAEAQELLIKPGSASKGVRLTITDAS